MVYHGRVAVAGITIYGKPFAAYAISGRSSGSKKRRFEKRDGHIYVGPLGEPTEEQRNQEKLIFYNTMRVRPDGLLVVTNGAQTDVSEVDGVHMPNFYKDFNPRNPRESASHIMMTWNYEPDAPIFTPRTALVRYPDERALFSMATFDENDPDREPVAGASQFALQPGEAKALATYRGIDDEARPWRMNLFSNNIQPYLFDVLITGETPDGIAEELYEFVDPRFVVAVAAAVLKDGVWRTEVKNRYETEKDFARENL